MFQKQNQKQNHLLNTKHPWKLQKQLNNKIIKDQQPQNKQGHFLYREKAKLLRKMRILLEDPGMHLRLQAQIYFSFTTTISFQLILRMFCYSNCQNWILHPNNLLNWAKSTSAPQKNKPINWKQSQNHQLQKKMQKNKRNQLLSLTRIKFKLFRKKPKLW